MGTSQVNFMHEGVLVASGDNEDIKTGVLKLDFGNKYNNATDRFLHVSIYLRRYFLRLLPLTLPRLRLLPKRNWRRFVIAIVCVECLSLSTLTPPSTARRCFPHPQYAHLISYR